MSFSPIIVTVYDRIEHLKKCICSLQNNTIASKSILYVVSDAAYKEEHRENVQRVRDYAQTIDGFLEVKCIFRDKNLGMHKSSLDGINEVFETYDNFIILEDDIVVSPDFLQYLNDGLAYYENDPKVFSISAFRLPFKMPQNYKDDVYFYPYNSPWGFATWKDRWTAINHTFYDRYSELKKDKERYKQFLSAGFFIKGILIADSKGEIEADDLRVRYYMFQNNMYSVFPIVSKSQNWGHDGSGEHCDNTKAWWGVPELDLKNKPTKFIPFQGFDKELLINHSKFLDKINGGIVAKYLKYTWVHALYKKLKKFIKCK